EKFESKSGLFETTRRRKGRRWVRQGHAGPTAPGQRGRRRWRWTSPDDSVRINAILVLIPATRRFASDLVVQHTQQKRPGHHVKVCTPDRQQTILYRRAVHFPEEEDLFLIFFF
ncbi:Uncharacterized protein APZ42_002944, partial [Daphnia magna]